MMEIRIGFMARNFFVSGGDGLQIGLTEPEAAGQLPLREVMDTLPGFGSDSRIDSRNLGAQVKRCHDRSLMRGR
jgi:hypothetical protein